MAAPQKKQTIALDGEEVRAREQDGTQRSSRKDDAGRELFWARRPFEYMGQSLDRGQLIPLTGARNDEKLIRLGYVTALRKTDQVFDCNFCAGKFVDLSTRDGHCDKRHSQKVKGADIPWSDRGVTVDETYQESRAFERAQSEADQIAPLNLDKTAASRGIAAN